MLEKLIVYLKEKYHPVEAIILHGSRASAYNKEHSDWDFIVLTTHKVIQTQYRNEIDTANPRIPSFSITNTRRGYTK